MYKKIIVVFSSVLIVITSVLLVFFFKTTFNRPEISIISSFKEKLNFFKNISMDNKRQQTKQKDKNNSFRIIRCKENKIENEYFIQLKEKADYSECEKIKDSDKKGECVNEKLKKTAEKEQKAIIEFLENNSIEYKSFWVNNSIYLKNVTNEERLKKIYDMFSNKIESIKEGCSLTLH